MVCLRDVRPYHRASGTWASASAPRAIRRTGRKARQIASDVVPLEAVLLVEEIRHLCLDLSGRRDAHDLRGRRQDPADQPMLVGVDDPALRGPELDPDRDVTDHAVDEHGIEAVDGRRIAVHQRPVDPWGDDGLGDRAAQPGRLAPRLVASDPVQGEQACRRDHQEQGRGRHRRGAHGPGRTARRSPPRAPTARQVCRRPRRSRPPGPARTAWWRSAPASWAASPSDSPHPPTTPATDRFCAATACPAGSPSWTGSVLSLRPTQDSTR